jgi:hypothetical protein
MKLLDDMTEWVKEVPLAPQANQRFGNLAFRDYIALVEAVSEMCKSVIVLKSSVYRRTLKIPPSQNNYQLNYYLSYSIPTPLVTRLDWTMGQGMSLPSCLGYGAAWSQAGLVGKGKKMRRTR